MSVILNFINWFLGLGSVVFVPIIMFLLGLIFRVGLSKSIRSALLFGIGLSGLNLVINMGVAAMEPAITGLSKSLHVNLSTIDTGYANVGTAWGWPGVVWVVIGILVIDLILVSLNLTKTLWVDMWNIWHGQYIGAVMWAASGSLIVGVSSALLLLVINLFLADYNAKRFQEFNNMPGISVVATSGTFTGIFAMFFESILNKIPFIKDINASPENIRDKFGIFGEMSVVGAIVGLVIGLLGGLNINGILNLSISVATLLVLLPRILSIIAEGIIPLANGISKFMKTRFPGRELYIAVDPAVLLGDESVMASVVILYPLSILLCAFLPGNNIIPIASLAALPYWIGGMVPYTKGNVVHTIIIALLWIIPTTLIASNLAPIITKAFQLTGYFQTQISQGVLFSNWDEGGNFLLWILAKILNIVGIGM